MPDTLRRVAIAPCRYRDTRGTWAHALLSSRQNFVGLKLYFSFIPYLLSSEPLLLGSSWMDYKGWCLQRFLTMTLL